MRNSTIYDDKNDWLSRQLQEEKEAKYRVAEMLGLPHRMSDAQSLKKEHIPEHAPHTESGSKSDPYSPQSAQKTTVQNSKNSWKYGGYINPEV